MRRADDITKAGAMANVGMAGMKGVVGTLAGSPALLADAVHSLSDLLSDGVSLWAVRKARQPPSSTHPYGHGKFEAVGSACVGGLLISAGAGIGMHALQTAVEAASAGGHAPESLAMQLGAAGVAGLSVGIKEVLYQRTMLIATEVRSSTLAANAWHHRTDALSSVVALAGIVGSACGVPILDPVAGVLVSGLILKEGGHIGIDALKQLTDTQAEGEVLEQVARAAQAVPEVLWLSDLRGRVLGPHLLVDVCVHIDPAMSASVAQQVATRVRLAVFGAVPEVTELIIHFDTDVVEDDLRPPLHPRGATDAATGLSSSGAASTLLSGGGSGGSGGGGGGVAAASVSGLERTRSTSRPGGVRLRPLKLHPPHKRATGEGATDALELVEPPERVMRPQAEIKAEVRAALSTLPEVWGCSHIHLLWDAARGGTVVQANVIMDPTMRVLQAMRIGGLAKRELELIDDVVEADLHLELLLPCNMITKRELVPDELALHPSPVPPSPPLQAPTGPERDADLRRTASSTMEG